MWKIKRAYLFLAAGLACFILIFYLIRTKINEAKRKSSSDDSYKYYAPPTDETVAILIYPTNNPMTIKRNINYPIVLIGNKEEAEKITGRKLYPELLIEGHEWVEKIMDEYEAVLNESKEKGFYETGVGSDGYIYFITPKFNSGSPDIMNYIRNFYIDDDENVVCDSYMKSETLKTYFDEMGITELLLEYRPEFELISARRYRVPSSEKTVAILVYTPNNDRGHPVALFGDKEQTEQLMIEELKGMPLKPKKMFEGREWLVKIMDAYRASLEGAEGSKLYRREKTQGEMVFVTRKIGYIRRIGIDANTIYERYVQSELLKKYFDELGLTEEIDRPEFEINFMGEAYYVPPKDETTAILFYSPYNRGSYNRPTVLFGDKVLTEKITGILLEPGKVIEEREWLEKIMDAFAVAFEGLRKEEQQRILSNFRCGEIVFIMQSKGYQIAGFKVDECNTYYEYMGSGLLKQYFDELGLTKELLATEPNEAIQK
jgi:hypothetical protein